MLKLTGVEVELKGFNLKETSFEVGRGESLAVVGPSGAGKTVLLDAIAGVHTVKKGKITLNGSDITGVPPHERGIGYLPQHLALFPHLSVLENILFGAKARRLPPEKARARVAELAELLKINHLLTRRSVKTLSGGEKQRVALARTLMVDPSVVLLDEPFSALDSFTRKKLTIYLKEVFSQLKTTLVFVTHDLEEAFIMGEKVGVMFLGRIHQVGTREELYLRPATLEVASVFGGGNIFSGQVVEIKTGTSLVVKAAGDVSCELPWREKIKRGQRVFFGAHPREIAALPPGKAKTNCTPVRVKSVFEIPRGFLVVGTLAGSGQEVEVEVSAAGAERLELYPGSELDLSFPPDRCWVLPAAEN